MLLFRYTYFLRGDMRDNKRKQNGILKSKNFEEEVIELKELAGKIKDLTEEEKNENKKVVDEND